MPNTTQQLVQFLLKLDSSDIPEDVIHAGKRDFINYLSVAIYASKNPSLNIFLTLFANNTDKQYASILGTSIQKNLGNAALANGYLGHLEDFDNTHFPTIIHPFSPTFPAALAITEHMHISGLNF